MSHSLDSTNQHKSPLKPLPTRIFSDSLPRLRELVLVNTWGLISAAGPNLKSLDIQYQGPASISASTMSTPLLRCFLSDHPLLTSISIGDIHLAMGGDGSDPTEMRHLTDVGLTSRVMPLDPCSIFHCFRFGTFEPAGTLIIRKESIDNRPEFVSSLVNMTCTDKNAHSCSYSFLNYASTPHQVWEELCEAGVCDGVQTVELKEPHDCITTHEWFTPLFENSLPHLQTIRVSSGNTPAGEVGGSKDTETPLSDSEWANVCLEPILRCRAAIGKPVHLVEWLVGDNEDPVGSRSGGLTWGRLWMSYDFERYLK